MTDFFYNALFLLIICVNIFLVYMSVKYTRQSIKHLRRMNVLVFRLSILKKYGLDIYDKLPSYEEMVKDKKELTINNYINKHYDW